MKAIVHDTAGPTLEGDHPSPAIGPDEILVETARVLLSAGDHAAETRRRGFLGVPGRHVVGRVREGELVAIDPTIPCGRCPHCGTGLAAVCPQRRVVGHHGRDGGLADRIAVPEANLVPLPPGLDLDLAALAGPVGVGLALARRLQLAGASYVSILGDGPTALAAAAALATRHPATRILSDDPFTAAVAAKWSLKHRGVAEAGRRHDQETVAIFRTDPAALAIAAGMVRPRGRIAWCCEGIAPDADGLDALRRAEAELLGHATTSIAEGLDLLASAEIDPSPLLRRRIGLDDAPTALSTGRASDLDGTLVVVGDDAAAPPPNAAGIASA